MNNNLHLIDCMEYMKDIPDKHFDLAIVDPPYGIGHTGHRGGNNKAEINPDSMKWNKNPPSIDYFNELFRISKHQIIWGVNYYPYPLFVGGRIIWDKLNSGDFSDCEIAYTSMHFVTKKYSYRWNGMIQQNMKNKEIRIHPTQKPVALYKWQLANYAKPGDKLLDTHSGSGSFRIAAYDMGFDLVSCELDTDYCEDNKARYQKHIQQIDLFKPEEIQEKIYVDKELFNYFQKESSFLCQLAYKLSTRRMAFNQLRLLSSQGVIRRVFAMQNGIG